MLISGAGALALADQMPWRSVYLVMSGIMVLAMAINFFAGNRYGRAAAAHVARRGSVALH